MRLWRGVGAPEPPLARLMASFAGMTRKEPMRSSLEIAQDAELAPSRRSPACCPTSLEHYGRHKARVSLPLLEGPRMPGLGPKPAAIDVTIDADGRTVGLF